MTMRLRERVAIVTGGGEGLGGYVAERFALEGAKVVIADINEEAGRETVARIEAGGRKALLIKTDVGEESEVVSLAAQVGDQYGRVDILYNNAGVLLSGRDGKAHELSSDTWDRTMRVNARGLWLCTKYLVPLMMDYGGAMIHVGSPTPMNSSGAGITAYSASKAVALALTKVMAADYGPYRIRVNCIIPGVMDTPMNKSLMGNQAEQPKWLSRIPLGRFGGGQDIVGLAVFLASDEASYCTGGFYMADGGLTAY